MKAFVLAAGQGTRLMPLTLNIPKPMIPIVNKPVLEHTLENLRKYGLSDVVINIHRYPGMIKKYFGNGRNMGMNIVYSHEKKLLGTAGGVKKMENYFNNTFFVLSGDGLTDIDLQEVLNFHRNKKAFATMVLKKIDSKFEYGVTVVDRNKEIKKFVEKPSWSSVFANTVNTGIYVFEPGIFNFIPKGSFYDFGNQVWPALLKNKKKIYGYITESNWCDVGNLKEYRQGVKSALDGKTGIIIPGYEVKPGIWIDKGSVIERGVRLLAPCAIGKNCLIKKGSVIGSYTAVGAMSCIGRGAKVKNCIIWNNVTVDKNVELNNCIISHGARIVENISVFEGAVITMK